MKEDSFYWYPSCNESVYPDDHYVSFEFDAYWDMGGGPRRPASGRDPSAGHLREPQRGCYLQDVHVLQQHWVPSRLDYNYFTYDGNLMEFVIPIAMGVLDVLQLGDDPL